MHFKFPVSLCIILLCFVSCTNGNEKQLISNVWNKYKVSLSDKNGEQAVKYVDKNTIRYYSRYVNSIKNDDSVAVAGLCLTDQILILSARQMMTEYAILNMTPQSLYSFCVQKDFLSSQQMSDTKIDKIIITGDSASGMVDFQGKYAMPIEFRKEDAEWKINFVSMLTKSSKDVSAYMEKQIHEQGMTTSQFIYSMLSQLDSKPVSTSIWNAVKK